MSDPLKIVVFGSTGMVGKEVVKQGAERGMHVTAVTRKQPSTSLAGVAYKVGDIVNDAQFVKSCIEGQDVVISCLGIRLNGIGPWNTLDVATVNYLPQTARNIVQAMEEHSVRKLLVLSAAGASESYAQVPLWWKTFLFLTSVKYSYQCLDAMEQVYFQANESLDMCIIRPPQLTDAQDDATKHNVVAMDSLNDARGIFPTIPRASLARWILQECEDTRHGKFNMKRPFVLTQ